MKRTGTPFGFGSTGDQVIQGIGLSGKRPIDSGGSKGIGMATARALAGACAMVTLAVRRPDAGARGAES